VGIQIELTSAGTSHPPSWLGVQSQSVCAGALPQAFLFFFFIGVATLAQAPFLGERKSLGSWCVAECPFFMKNNFLGPGTWPQAPFFNEKMFLFISHEKS
jgi:hypothetical protein